ncbi:hypothetical protein [Mycoplasma sp. 3686d]|uniref:hypothetical protein n=1 Tax=Mycoplasma sp. 3686d TaxID=2967300 RepID=UPI00211D044B|nr:hypothetical protein [Mycoplasma sp. 3686d]UUM24569.1 hypothetical protein NPA12_02605 [Mycoplasma sp. 3686d]
MNQVNLIGVISRPIKWMLSYKNKQIAYVNLYVQNPDKTKSYISIYLTENFKQWEHLLTKDTKIFVQGQIATGYNSDTNKNYFYVLCHRIEFLHNKFSQNENLATPSLNTQNLIQNNWEFNSSNQSIFDDDKEWE